jgi:hypothetical protein
MCYSVCECTGLANFAVIEKVDIEIIHDYLMGFYVMEQRW